MLYVNHNIPSIVQWDPKASVLLWLERRRPAQNERHQKQYISGASVGGIFFQVVEVVQKQRYFKIRNLGFPLLTARPIQQVLYNL